MARICAGHMLAVFSGGAQLDDRFYTPLCVLFNSAASRRCCAER